MKDTFAVIMMVLYYVFAVVAAILIFVVALPLFVIGQIFYSIQTLYLEGKFRLL